ncbi:MAG: adenylate/guanylate cyclase domain-containing protein [Pirellulaceae bacterium]
MVELIARDTQSSRRWRRRLVDNQMVVLGRATPRFPIQWDSHISSLHAEVTWTGTELKVLQRSEAVNPIYYQSNPRISFVMHPGEHFVIGHTEFLLVRVDSTLQLPPLPLMNEVTLQREQVRGTSFRSAAGRIDLLCDLVTRMTSANGPDELAYDALAAILRGVPHAAHVALIDCSNRGQVDLRIRLQESRAGINEPFRPSQRLLEKSLHTGMCVIHVWRAEADSNYTQLGVNDWAMALPIDKFGGDQRFLYLTGTRPKLSGAFSEVETLQDDIKYAELVASTYANLARNMSLELRQAALHQFFSPNLLDLLQTDRLDQQLAPREVPLTVMFCDLRGFSRETEKQTDLLEGLEKVSQAMTVMTREILAHGGVVGDFHGDSAMGFWGWPLPDEGAAINAVRAARAILQKFAGDSTQVGRWRDGIGIGIATGTGVAGMIGSEDQVKVTAFGPPVNLAARLEGLTKRLRTSLLVDEPTQAAWTGGGANQDAHAIRVGKVRPLGMDLATTLYFMIPDGQELDAADRFFLQAVEAFEQGDWPMAKMRIQALAEEDTRRTFLEQAMENYGGVCPSPWDGVVSLLSK